MCIKKVAKLALKPALATAANIAIKSFATCKEGATLDNFRGEAAALGEKIASSISPKNAALTNMVSNAAIETIAKYKNKSHKMEKKEMEEKLKQERERIKKRTKKYAIAAGAIGVIAGGVAGYSAATIVYKNQDTEMVFSDKVKTAQPEKSLEQEHVNRNDKPEENGFIVSENGAVWIKDNFKNPPVKVKDIVAEDVMTAGIPGVNQYVENIYEDDNRDAVQK